jgi:hypothetical protein
MRVIQVRRPQLGFSTVEQMAVVGLIGVSCIGAIVLLGSSVGNGFGSINAGIPETKTIAAVRTPSQIPTGNINNQVNMPQGNSPEAGSNIDLHSLDYATNVSNSIETSGANGTTDLLLSKFDIAIRDLLAEGAINEAEASSLRELSNLGHQMGDIESLLEQQFEINGHNPNAFKNTEFTYNGNKYQFSQLVAQIQLVPTGNGGFGPGISQSVMAKFMAKQKTSVDSLQNERARSILGSLSTAIMTVADATEGAANDTRTGFTTTEFRNLLSRYAEDVDPSKGKYPPVSNLASSITHGSSASICSLGNGANDNSKKCTK